MHNYFKTIAQDEEKCYFDYYKLILFFVLYSDTPNADYATKVEQLFLAMSDE